MVRWLERFNTILHEQDINTIPQLQSITAKEKETLKQIGATLAVPLRTGQGRLSGLLILGPKRSGQRYNVEDEQLIYALGGQAATNLENARLYNEMQQVRASLEAWLNSMTDCVLIIDADYLIQFMNAASLKTFGDRTGGNCWYALGKDGKCTRCPIDWYLSGDRDGFRYSEKIQNREYDVAIAPLSAPDEDLSVIEVLRDVTEHRLAEEKQKQLQEELHIASRLASIGELAAGVAHEINNPLTGILGFSQRLLKKTTDEAVKRDLQRVYNEALRAARVVDNLRTFARRNKPKKEYLNVNDVVRKSLEMRIYELRTGNIEATTQLEAALPTITADFQQLQQVFLNIIINAEQAMTEANGRGKLIIETEKGRDRIKVLFTDDGPGISRENLKNLFQPFFTTRADRGGTGLGLSVCHGIVLAHGGKIYAKSALGKGTTFVVELPVGA